MKLDEVREKFVARRGETNQNYDQALLILELFFITIACLLLKVIY